MYPRYISVIPQAYIRLYHISYPNRRWDLRSLCRFVLVIFTAASFVSVSCCCFKLWFSLMFYSVSHSVFDLVFLVPIQFIDTVLLLQFYFSCFYFTVYFCSLFLFLCFVIFSGYVLSSFISLLFSFFLFLFHFWFYSTDSCYNQTGEAYETRKHT